MMQGMFTHRNNHVGKVIYSTDGGLSRMICLKINNEHRILRKIPKTNVRLKILHLHRQIKSTIKYHLHKFNSVLTDHYCFS